MREAGVATEVVAVFVGSAAAVETLRTALGDGRRPCRAGQDRGWPSSPCCRQTAGGGLLAVKNVASLIAGKQAIDDDNNQTGQMLAGLLGLSAGDVQRRRSIRIDGRCLCGYEVDGGSQTVSLTLPAVITADLSPQCATLRRAAGHHEALSASRSPKWIAASLRCRYYSAPARTDDYGARRARAGARLVQCGRTGRGSCAPRVVWLTTPLVAEHDNATLGDATARSLTAALARRRSRSHSRSRTPCGSGRRSGGATRRGWRRYFTPMQHTTPAGRPKRSGSSSRR